MRPGKSTAFAVIGICGLIGAVIAVIGWFSFKIAHEDLACSKPGATISCADSTSHKATTVPTTIAPTTTVPERLVPVTTTPATTQPTATSKPPLLAPVGSTRATPTPTTTTTTSSTKMTTTTPAPAGPVKVGTLDTYGRVEKCSQGGVPVSLGSSATQNGVRFTLIRSGKNNTPELQIVGAGNYSFPEIRVVTTDAADEFTGHIQSRDTHIPSGTVSIAYDVLATGSSLKGIVACL